MRPVLRAANITTLMYRKSGALTACPGVYRDYFTIILLTIVCQVSTSSKYIHKYINIYVCTIPPRSFHLVADRFRHLILPLAFYFV